MIKPRPNLPGERLAIFYTRHTTVERKKKVQFQMWISFQFFVALDVKSCCHLCKHFSDTRGHNCCRWMCAQKPLRHRLLQEASWHHWILHFHRLPFNLLTVVAEGKKTNKKTPLTFPAFLSRSGTPSYLLGDNINLNHFSCPH